MVEIVRHTQRNVKRWQGGDMRKRWTAAGMLVAEQQFRRIIGLSCPSGGDSSVGQLDLDAGAAEVDHRDQGVG
jgi:hypothetical protein